MKVTLVISALVVMAAAVTGKRMKKRGELCDNVTCENGATCIEEGWVSEEGWACQCTEGYTGKFCGERLPECREGGFIHKAWVCDCENDCESGSDEEGCDEAKCFQCAKSEKTMPMLWRCDGVADCGSDDTSDEDNCPKKATTEAPGGNGGAPPSPCACNPCMNGGSCSVVSYGGMQGYSCDCTQDFEGYDCQDAVAKKRELATLLRRYLKTLD